MFRGRGARGTPKKDGRPKSFGSPIEELNYLLDNLDELIVSGIQDYADSIRPPPPESSRKSTVLDSFKNFRSQRGGLASPSASSTTPKVTVATTTPTSSTTSSTRKKNEDARFLPMPQEQIEDFVESIRRIAELVIIGERSHAKDESSENAEDYLAIFETFFERQGLATITNVLTGVAFDLASYPTIIAPQATTQTDNNNGDSVQLSPVDLNEHQYILLAPLPICIQAIQSVSILVQNVSRATSLFFLLSNNHVNELINFPLEEYHIAERRKHNQDGNGFSPRKFVSPELAELTTHFVTFLKSLALRMNAETLQFFLTYPGGMPHEEVEDIIIEDKASFDLIQKQSHDTEDDEDRPMDEVRETKQTQTLPESPRPISIKTVTIEFPLYERALEFCSVHHDSFIRITAMNICLNTLRLATVTPSEGGADDGGDADVGKSPDGVLHNAKPLPLKERVSIAQYVCTPARVERLASPIFTKLAQLWGVLEEQFREMDAASTPGEPSVAKGKVAKAKEKARRQKYSGAFNDTAYNVQDELLLLEDVLKVGLTSLNEQAIEMMFATFVYPLLLQPLLLYFQRSPIPDEVLFADPLKAHSPGGHIVDSDMTATEKALISAPAKSALFCLTAAFQFLTHPALLRLLFTALFHPMAPEATGEMMIRSKADVACLGPDGKVRIRIDTIDAETDTMKMASDRSTYHFGAITGRKCLSSQTENKGDDETACVFVLAPALAEILEFRGDDGKLVARTRENPYRKAIFQCFSLCSQLSGLQPLSVLAVEAGVSKFGSKFLTEILFGQDLQRFHKTLPADQEKLNTMLSRLDDRGMGSGSSAGQSRLSLGPLNGVSRLDPMEEVLSAFRTAIIKAVPAGKGTWKLKYDPIASHALLHVVSGDAFAIRRAAKEMDARCRQTAAFLSDIPKKLERFGAVKLAELLLGPKKNFKDLLTMQGLIYNAVFCGYGDKENTCILEEMVELKSNHLVDGRSGYAVSVSSIGSYKDLCSQCSAFPPIDAELAEGALRAAVGSTKAWVRLGK